jgi:hypothetical protein
MLTIREQILQLIKTELAKITTANGYVTNIGTHVYRGRYDLVEPELPGIVMIAEQDTNVEHLGHGVHEMPLTIDAFSKFVNSEGDASERAARTSEHILGDIQACMLATRITMPFTSGIRQPQIGITLTGSASSATAVLESITLSSGSWSLGTAAGTFLLRLPWGEFTTENFLNSGGETIAATTGVGTRYDLFSDLLNNVEYQRGGLDPLPDPGDDIVKISVSFSIFYATLAGNPYKQS